MDRKWWTLVAVCVGTFMLLLDVTIVNVALPEIQAKLHASFSDLQWVVDAYALLLAALLLTTGSLADLYGRRLVFVVGLVLFTLSSLASGLAQSPLWLNLARGAQGVGGAAMFSTSLALLGSAFQGRERGTAFGVWGAITGLAVAIGPVIGGALTTGISWRWIFLVNVPIGVVAVFLTLARVEESRQPGNQRIDPLGVITFTGALGALVYALIKANEKGWGSPLILCLLGGALLGLVLFIVAELVQRDRAMFDLSLFRKPTFTGGLIAAFALSGGLFALFLYLTLYLQDVLGYSALQTGLRFLVLSGGILLTSTLAGRLTAHVPIRLLIAPGLVLVGVGLLLMRGVHAGTHWEHLIPGFIIAGAGVGFINPPLASTAIGVVTPDRAGMASGINSTFRQVGIATGIAALGTVFAHTVSTHIESALSAVRGVPASASHALAQTVSQGSGAAGGLGAIPARARPAAAHAVRAAFTTGLNEVFLIAALLSLVAAVLTLLLIRSRDFETGAARGGGGQPQAAQPAPAAEPAATAEPEPAAESVPAVESAPAAGPAPARAAEPAEPGPLRDVRSDSEALIAAATQATRDYEQRIEAEIARHRESEMSDAESRSRELLNAALERSDRYAAELRRRGEVLLAERDRLVAQLRERSDAAAHHAERAARTRAALYRVIGELGSVDVIADGHTERADGDGDGQAGAPRAGNGHWAPAPAREG
jgi:EmrB/QacA subfamily drug resistance transporter